jgi:hypothetical protein
MKERMLIFASSYGQQTQSIFFIPPPPLSIL